MKENGIEKILSLSARFVKAKTPLSRMADSVLSWIMPTAKAKACGPCAYTWTETSYGPCSPSHWCPSWLPTCPGTRYRITVEWCQVPGAGQCMTGGGGPPVLESCWT